MSMHYHSSILLLLLLLCLLSMHACSSRTLSNKKKLHSIKAEKEMTTMLHSTTFNPSEEKEVKVLTHHEGSDATSTTDKKTKEKITRKDLNSTLTKEEAEEKKKMSNPAGVAQRDQSLVSVSFRVPHKKQGSEVILSYDLGLHHSNIEGLGMKAQSVLRSDPHHGTEETINSKENGVDHNVAAMDYEPPHRRPPIHNLSP